MTHIKNTICIVLTAMFFFTVTTVSLANTPQGAASLIVIDSSKEEYGDQLKKKIYSEVSEKTSVRSVETSELAKVLSLERLTQLSAAEKEEIDRVAKGVGADALLIVEILPFKADYRQILFYQSVDVTATFRVRLYDANEQKYTFVEDVSGYGGNRTIIPWTFVTKKPAVLKAVSSANDIMISKIKEKLKVLE